MNLTATRTVVNNPLQAIKKLRVRSGGVYSAIIVLALIAFEAVNYSTTAYALRFFGGDQMGGADVNLPHEVKPGETIDISVTFTAPASTGIKHGNWTLQNDKGQNFKPIVWVEIEVVSSLASTSTTIAATPTLTPTETPTPAASTDVP